MTKDTISQIEIHTSERLVPPNTFIVDTPGIDAADDADRYMTESSLHLVDVLYYVMDYNHVQSEINFTFLKQIQDKNIPIYIIINQVDKHNDEELSFEQFAQRVEDSFKQWSIYPERIYYSSVMDQRLSFNELTTIKEDLFDLLHNHAPVTNQVAHATEQVVSSHREKLKDEFEQKVAQFASESFDESDWTTIVNKIKAIDDRVVQFEMEFTDRKSTRLNSSHEAISYDVFCLKN